MKTVVFIVVLLSSCFYAYANDEDVSTPPSYSTPLPSGDVYIAEPFDSNDALDRWTHSKATKDGVDSDIAKYNGKWSIQSSIEDALLGDTGLLLKEKAKHHAIAVSLDRPFVFDGAPFVMQYEVNFQSGLECGGAYVKLLTQIEDMDLETFHDKTPYTIMFGPDKCGEDYKLHFIFRHKNPKTGEFEEKHAKKPTTDFKSYFSDKSSHLYTLVVLPDNSFTIYIDQTVINSGNLLQDFSPPVNPPKEIVDKEDKKPEDWDEREKIPDPTASKPEDWDESAPKKITDPAAEIPDDWLEEEPLYIDDPESFRPEDWDDEMDGEWEAPKVDNPKCKEVSGCGAWEPPMIDNPAFKGKWVTPQITNPNYKGIWKPRVVPNPDYFEDTEPYKMTSIGGVGFELWSMSENILFDNVIITSEKSVADDYAEKTWKIKKTYHGRNEPGLLTELFKTMEEKPWLWVVVVLVVGLPLVLIYSFCCGGTKEEDSKKTDEPTPEDDHDSEEESKDDVKEDDNEEPDGEEEPQDEEEETDGAAGDGKPSVTKADLEVDDDDVIDALDDDNKVVKQSPRKRRVRKQE